MYLLLLILNNLLLVSAKTFWSSYLSFPHIFRMSLVLPLIPVTCFLSEGENFLLCYWTNKPQHAHSWARPWSKSTRSMQGFEKLWEDTLTQQRRPLNVFFFQGAVGLRAADGCNGSNLATPLVPWFLWSNAKSMYKFTLLPTQICFLLAPSVYLHFRKPCGYFYSWYSSYACFYVWQKPFHREVTPLCFSLRTSPGIYFV